MPINVTGRIIHGTNSSDLLQAGWGHDTIYGYLGADSLYGNDGNDTLIGGIDGALDYINGGSGFDTVDYTETSLDMTINLALGTASTNSQAVLSSGPFGDFYYYYWGALEDTLVSVEAVNAGSGNDTITGDNSANTLNGNAGNDVIMGLGGADILNGGKGNDVINGGKGQDVMTGGLGNDNFVFENFSEAHGDFITDFVTGQDKIDVSKMDANPFLRGDQAFTVAKAGFSGKAGQLAEIEYLSSQFSEVWGGDLDGDGNADFIFAVKVAGGDQASLSASDFIL